MNFERQSLMSPYRHQKEPSSVISTQRSVERGAVDGIEPSSGRVIQKDGDQRSSYGLDRYLREFERHEAIALGKRAKAPEGTHC